jgi:DNA polymerase I-like protein with 3'-5' exonuclease and polymerase domains
VLGLPYLIRNMSMRQCGKKSNHGLNYDERYRTFALINDMLERDAKRIIDKYHSIYPGIRQAYDRIKNQLSRNRTLTNPFGRKYKFLGKWDDSTFKQAYSYLPQSTVGDVLNGFGHDGGICGLYYDQHKHEPLSKLEQLIQVHDSLLCQYPIDKLWDMAYTCLLVKDYLEPTIRYEERFYIETDLKIGMNWGEMQKVPLGSDHHQMFTNLKGAIQLCQAGNSTTGSPLT